MRAKLKRALGIAAMAVFVGSFAVALVFFVVAVVMNVYNQPGRDQAGRDQVEVKGILASSHQKTPYFDIKESASVRIVAKGAEAPYEVLSPGLQLKSNCIVSPTGKFSRIGDIFVGKRFLVSYDKMADDGPSDECAAGSLFLWGPIDQPSLGHAVGNTPNGK